MTLDDATTAFLTNAAASGGPALHEMTPAQAREMNNGMTPMFGEGPEIADVRDVSIESEGGAAFPARIFQPDAAKGVIVYFHGGGWVIGDVAGFDTLCRQIAEKTGFTVLLAAYRKAPEVPFPGAYDDAWAALSYASDHLRELASAGTDIIVSGDSSGGNLAAVVAQRAAAEGGPAIALQALVYPVVDADFENETYSDPQNALFLTKEAMGVFWDAYVPDASARRDPRVAPLHGSVEGVAPALVILAEHDVLRHEGEKYAQKLRHAGIPVEETVIAGQMHGFFTMPNLLPGAAEALEVYTAAIARV